jgi:hypothetical protein
VVGLDPKHIEYNMEKRSPKKAYYVFKELWTENPYQSRKMFLIPAIVFFISSILLLLARSKPKK